MQLDWRERGRHYSNFHATLFLISFLASAHSCEQLWRSDHSASRCDKVSTCHAGGSVNSSAPDMDSQRRSMSASFSSEVSSPTSGIEVAKGRKSRFTDLTRQSSGRPSRSVAFTPQKRPPATIAAGIRKASALQRLCGLKSALPLGGHSLECALIRPVRFKHFAVGATVRRRAVE